MRIGEIAMKNGLVGGPFGSSLVGSDYAGSGVPVIRGSNMGGRYISGEFVFVTFDKFTRDLSRNAAEPGDIIFTQRGTLGQVSLVPESPEKIYVVSQSQMRLRVDSAKVDPLYVYYACMCPSFLRQIDEMAVRTGVPHINLGVLGKLRIPDKSRREQQAVAEILGALDDKIAANSSIVETSDALAQVLYAASARGVERLTGLASFVNGRNFTKDATGDGRMVIRIAELKSGISGSTVRNQVDAPDVHLARPGDILFAWSGSLTLHRWSMSEALINQHIFKVIPCPGVPDWLVYQALAHQMPEFRSIAADKATTMGHIQRRHLDVDVPAPERGDWDRLDATISPLWERSLNAVVESHALAQLRDTLLPALMDGTMRVKDAVAQAEEVL